MGYLTMADYDGKVKLWKLIALLLSTLKGVDIEFSKIIIKYIGIYYCILYSVNFWLNFDLWLSLTKWNNFSQHCEWLYSQLKWKELLFVKVVILLHIKLTGMNLFLGKMSFSFKFLLKRLSHPWLFSPGFYIWFFFHYWWSVYDSLKLISD